MVQSKKKEKEKRKEEQIYFKRYWEEKTGSILALSVTLAHKVEYQPVVRLMYYIKNITRKDTPGLGLHHKFIPSTARAHQVGVSTHCKLDVLYQEHYKEGYPMFNLHSRMILSIVMAHQVNYRPIVSLICYIKCITSRTVQNRISEFSDIQIFRYGFWLSKSDLKLFRYPKYSNWVLGHLQSVDVDHIMLMFTAR